MYVVHRTSLYPSQSLVIVMICWYDNRIERRNSRLFTTSSLRREMSPTCSGQGTMVFKSRAEHWALITCNTSCAKWYEGTAQLLSLKEFQSHLFKLAEPLTDQYIFLSILIVIYTYCYLYLLQYNILILIYTYCYLYLSQSILIAIYTYCYLYLLLFILTHRDHAQHINRPWRRKLHEQQLFLMWRASTCWLSVEIINDTLILIITTLWLLALNPNRQPQPCTTRFRNAWCYGKNSHCGSIQSLCQIEVDRIGPPSVNILWMGDIISVIYKSHCRENFLGWSIAEMRSSCFSYVKPWCKCLNKRQNKTTTTKSLPGTKQNIEPLPFSPKPPVISIFTRLYKLSRTTYKKAKATGATKKQQLLWRWRASTREMFTLAGDHVPWAVVSPSCQLFPFLRPFLLPFSLFCWCVCDGGFDVGRVVGAVVL